MNTTTSTQPKAPAADEKAKADAALAANNAKRVAHLVQRDQDLGKYLVKSGAVTEAEAAKHGFDPVDALKTAHGKLHTALKRARGEVARAKQGGKRAKSSARDVGPLDKQASADDLLAAIRAADKVEVVASDGTRELTDIPTLEVDADAFRGGGGGLLLDDVEFEVHSPAPNKPSVTLAGWGLLLDGKLAAYRARNGGPLTLGGGRKFNLAGDVMF